MFSRFFIDRPIFAAVVSIFIVLAGLAAMRNLPIAQYPEIAPPVVTVQAVYPGASAETLEQTVAAPLENQITGIEKMIYMSSTSGSNGIVQIQVTFDIGADADQAALNVNNRVKQAEPRLPEEVRRQGVTVQKGSSAFLQVLAFYSPDGRYDNLAISNFVTLNVLDALKRVPGTTNVQIFGAKDYAMRIWVRPDRLTQLRLTPTDLIRALNEQNAQFAAGKVGQSPSAGPQELVYTITTKGRLADPKEFENIILRANPDGSNLRLKDVARVELASKDYEFVGRMNGREATLVGVFLLPGANALEVADSVVKTVDEIVPRFPQGMTYSVPYDTTRFVRVSIREVLFTLGEAMLLVVLVVFLFLQNWRATLIPIAAVPVSLIGCFAGLYMLGYSINTLTLFGMVLAIGIVVDDAIVVLENIERIMHEEHLAAREAAIKAMREVAGPVVAIVLVLCSVFVPIAFLGGLAGELYRQFAVTIAIAVVISGIVALTLTPSLCVLILKREHKIPGGFFQWFNETFLKITIHYTNGVSWMVRRAAIGVLVFLGMVAIAVGLWKFTPGSLVPDEDQGFYISAVILPDGATLERTDKVVAQVLEAIKSNPNNQDAVAFTGFDFLGGYFRNNAATIFVTQKPWDERKVDTKQVVGDLFMKTGGIKEGLVLAFGPPPIFGLGTAGGFELYLQDRGEGGARRMAQAMGQFMQQTAKDPKFAFVQTLWRAAAPGISSGQAIEEVERIAREALPADFSFDWGGASYQEKKSGGTSVLALGLAVIMVFLILAAQYERWSLPLSVLLALPFGTFGALAAVYLRGYTNDVYFQIGLVTLLGLAAKNAILIVQFAELKEREGLSPAASALEAARLRFRPILMTSLAFIFGVMPLALSTGAGAGARRSVGTGVMGGMMAATFLAIFFVPMFFKLLATRRLRETRSTAEIREEIRHSTGVAHDEPQHCFHHAPHAQAGDRPQEQGNA